MKLWVDYTNHRGKRSWREIEPGPRGSPFEQTIYPPALKMEDVQAYIDRTGKRPEVQPTIEVWMVDRNAFRTLALCSIHGFAWQASEPESHWRYPQDKSA